MNTTDLASKRGRTEMGKEIKVPTLGESVTEATVAKWFKAVGDPVAADEPLVELETDKVTVEVNAPAAGMLSEIHADEGTDVGVGAILGLIGEGEAGALARPAAAPAPAPTPTLAPAPDTEAEAPLSPAVRRMIEEHGLDAAAIPATGKGGRLVKEDVLAFLETPRPAPEAAIPPAPAVPPPAETPSAQPVPTGPRPEATREERVRMSRLRRRVAERLKEAQHTAAMLTTFNEVDLTAVSEARRTYRESFEKKHDVRLGFMSFFVKASVAALQEFPAVNAEIDGDDVVYKNYYNIGVAVGTPQGLVVPVVRDADRLSFAAVEKTINELALKARDGKLSMEELAGGTFTISNGGVYGSMLSTPILNPPQSGILGMHAIVNRPMVVDGEIKVRPMMYVALSYDHRIVDGREAVSFLVRIKQCVEDPSRILLDM